MIVYFLYLILKKENKHINVDLKLQLRKLNGIIISYYSIQGKE